MKLIKSFIFLILIMLGCSPQESEPSVTVPDHLRDLENLTIYPANAEPAMEIELVRDSSYGDSVDS